MLIPCGFLTYKDFSNTLIPHYPDLTDLLERESRCYFILLHEPVERLKLVVVRF